MNNDVVSEDSQGNHEQNINNLDEVPPPSPPHTHSLFSAIMSKSSTNRKTSSPRRMENDHSADVNSDNKDLRMRIRNERQKRLKEKILLIKRKQKENIQSSPFPKRAKSLIIWITVGFIVGAVCVSAYFESN